MSIEFPLADNMQHELTKIIKGGSLSSIAQFLGYGLSFISSIVIARIVGAEVMGIIALGMSIIGVFQVFLVMGMDRGALQYVSSLYGKKDIDGIKSIIKFLQIFSLLFSLFIFLLYFTLLRKILPQIFPKILPIQKITDYFLIILPLLSLSVLYGNILTALQRPHHQPIADSIIRTTSRMALVVILVIWMEKLKATVLATILSITIVFLFLQVILNKEVNSLNKELSIDKSINNDPTNLRKFILFSIPLVLIPIFNLTIKKIDIIFTGFFLNAQQVGIYTIIKTVGILISAPLLMFGGVTAATISKLLVNNDIKIIREVYQTSTMWITFFSGGIFIIIFALGKDILALFGPEFTQGENALRIFAVGQLINVCVGPTNYTLLMFKRRGLVLFNSFLTAILGVLFMLYFIPKFNFMGGALAVSMSVGIVNMISLFQIIYFLDIVPGSITAMMLRLLPIATTTLILICSKNIFIEFKMILRLSLNFLLSLFCYISLIYLIKILSNDKNRTLFVGFN